MSERDIEKYLKKQVEELGGVCYKWTSPGRRGVPDRICIFPNNLVFFVECKYGKNTLSVLQKMEITQLRRLGCEVYVLSTKEEVIEFMDIVRLRTALIDT